MCFVVNQSTHRQNSLIMTCSLLETNLSFGRVKLQGQELSLISSRYGADNDTGLTCGCVCIRVLCCTTRSLPYEGELFSKCLLGRSQSRGSATQHLSYSFRATKDCRCSSSPRVWPGSTPCSETEAFEALPWTFGG